MPRATEYAHPFECATEYAHQFKWMLGNEASLPVLRDVLAAVYEGSSAPAPDVRAVVRETHYAPRGLGEEGLCLEVRPLDGEGRALVRALSTPAVQGLSTPAVQKADERGFTKSLWRAEHTDEHGEVTTRNIPRPHWDDRLHVYRVWDTVDDCEYCTGASLHDISDASAVEWSPMRFNQPYYAAGTWYSWGGRALEAKHFHFPPGWKVAMYDPFTRTQWQTTGVYENEQAFREDRGRPEWSVTCPYAVMREQPVAPAARPGLAALAVGGDPTRWQVVRRRTKAKKDKKAPGRAPARPKPPLPTTGPHQQWVRADRAHVEACFETLQWFAGSYRGQAPRLIKDGALAFYFYFEPITQQALKFTRAGWEEYEPDFPAATGVHEGWTRAGVARRSDAAEQYAARARQVHGIWDSLAHVEFEWVDPCTDTLYATFYTVDNQVNGQWLAIQRWPFYDPEARRWSSPRVLQVEHANGLTKYMWTDQATGVVYYTTDDYKELSAASVYTGKAWVRWLNCIEQDRQTSRDWKQGEAARPVGLNEAAMRSREARAALRTLSARKTAVGPDGAGLVAGVKPDPRRTAHAAGVVFFEKDPLRLFSVQDEDSRWTRVQDDDSKWTRVRDKGKAGSSLVTLGFACAPQDHFSFWSAVRDQACNLLSVPPDDVPHVYDFVLGWFKHLRALEADDLAFLAKYNGLGRDTDSFAPMLQKHLLAWTTNLQEGRAVGVGTEALTMLSLLGLPQWAVRASTLGQAGRGDPADNYALSFYVCCIDSDRDLVVRVAQPHETDVNPTRKELVIPLLESRLSAHVAKRTVFYASLGALDAADRFPWLPRLAEAALDPPPLHPFPYRRKGLFHMQPIDASALGDHPLERPRPTPLPLKGSEAELFLVQPQSHTYRWAEEEGPAEPAVEGSSRFEMMEARFLAVGGEKNKKWAKTEEQRKEEEGQKKEEKERTIQHKQLKRKAEAYTILLQRYLVPLEPPEGVVFSDADVRGATKSAKIKSAELERYMSEFPELYGAHAGYVDAGAYVVELFTEHKAMLRLLYGPVLPQRPDGASEETGEEGAPPAEPEDPKAAHGAFTLEHFQAYARFTLLMCDRLRPSRVDVEWSDFQDWIGEGMPTNPVSRFWPRNFVDWRKEEELPSVDGDAQMSPEYHALHQRLVEAITQHNGPEDTPDVVAVPDTGEFIQYYSWWEQVRKGALLDLQSYPDPQSQRYQATLALAQKPLACDVPIFAQWRKLRAMQSAEDARRAEQLRTGEAAPEEGEAAQEATDDWEDDWGQSIPISREPPSRPAPQAGTGRADAPPFHAIRASTAKAARDAEMRAKRIEAVHAELHAERDVLHVRGRANPVLDQLTRGRFFRRRGPLTHLFELADSGVASQAQRHLFSMEDECNLGECSLQGLFPPRYDAANAPIVREFQFEDDSRKYPAPRATLAQLRVLSRLYDPTGDAFAGDAEGVVYAKRSKWLNFVVVRPVAGSDLALCEVLLHSDLRGIALAMLLAQERDLAARAADKDMQNFFRVFGGHVAFVLAEPDGALTRLSMEPREELARGGSGQPTLEGLMFETMVLVQPMAAKAQEIYAQLVALRADPLHARPRPVMRAQHGIGDVRWQIVDKAPHTTELVQDIFFLGRTEPLVAATEVMGQLRIARSDQKVPMPFDLEYIQQLAYNQKNRVVVTVWANQGSDETVRLLHIRDIYDYREHPESVQRFGRLLESPLLLYVDTEGDLDDWKPHTFSNATRLSEVCHALQREDAPTWVAYFTDGEYTACDVRLDDMNKTLADYNVLNWSKLSFLKPADEVAYTQTVEHHKPIVYAIEEDAHVQALRVTPEGRFQLRTERLQAHLDSDKRAPERREVAPFTRMYLALTACLDIAQPGMPVECALHFGVAQLLLDAQFASYVCTNDAEEYDTHEYDIPILTLVQSAEFKEQLKAVAALYGAANPGVQLSLSDFGAILWRTDDVHAADVQAPMRTLRDEVQNMQNRPASWPAGVPFAFPESVLSRLPPKLLLDTITSVLQVLKNDRGVDIDKLGMLQKMLGVAREHLLPRRVQRPAEENVQTGRREPKRASEDGTSNSAKARRPAFTPDSSEEGIAKAKRARQKAAEERAARKEQNDQAAREREEERHMVDDSIPEDDLDDSIPEDDLDVAFHPNAPTTLGAPATAHARLAQAAVASTATYVVWNPTKAIFEKLVPVPCDEKLEFHELHLPEAERTATAAHYNTRTWPHVKELAELKAEFEERARRFYVGYRALLADMVAFFHMFRALRYSQGLTDYQWTGPNDLNFVRTVAPDSWEVRLRQFAPDWAPTVIPARIMRFEYDTGPVLGYVDRLMTMVHLALQCFYEISSVLFDHVKRLEERMACVNLRDTLRPLSDPALLTRQAHKEAYNAIVVGTTAIIDSAQNQMRMKFYTANEGVHYILRLSPNSNLTVEGPDILQAFMRRVPRSRDVFYDRHSGRWLQLDRMGVPSPLTIQFPQWAGGAFNDPTVHARAQARTYTWHCEANGQDYTAPYPYAGGEHAWKIVIRLPVLNPEGKRWDDPGVAVDPQAAVYTWRDCMQNHWVHSMNDPDEGWRQLPSRAATADYIEFPGDVTLDRIYGHVGDAYRLDSRDFMLLSPPPRPERTTRLKNFQNPITATVANERYIIHNMTLSARRGRPVEVSVYDADEQALLEAGRNSKGKGPGRRWRPEDDPDAPHREPVEDRYVYGVHGAPGAEMDPARKEVYAAKNRERNAYAAVRADQGAYGVMNDVVLHDDYINPSTRENEESPMTPWCTRIPVVQRTDRTDNAGNRVAHRRISWLPRAVFAPGADRQWFEATIPTRAPRNASSWDEHWWAVDLPSARVTLYENRRTGDRHESPNYTAMRRERCLAFAQWLRDPANWFWLPDEKKFVLFCFGAHVVPSPHKDEYVQEMLMLDAPLDDKALEDEQDDGASATVEWQRSFLSLRQQARNAWIRIDKIDEKMKFPKHIQDKLMRRVRFAEWSREDRQAFATIMQRRMDAAAIDPSIVAYCEFRQKRMRDLQHEFIHDIPVGSVEPGWLYKGHDGQFDLRAFVLLRQMYVRGRFWRAFQAKFGVQYQNYLQNAVVRHHIDTECPGFLGPRQEYQAQRDSKAGSLEHRHQIVLDWDAERDHGGSFYAFFHKEFNAAPGSNRDQDAEFIQRHVVVGRALAAVFEPLFLQCWQRVRARLGAAGEEGAALATAMEGLEGLVINMCRAQQVVWARDPGVDILLNQAAMDAFERAMHALIAEQASRLDGATDVKPLLRAFVDGCAAPLLASIVARILPGADAHGAVAHLFEELDAQQVADYCLQVHGVAVRSSFTEEYLWRNAEDQYKPIPSMRNKNSATTMAMKAVTDYFRRKAAEVEAAHAKLTAKFGINIRGVINDKSPLIKGALTEDQLATTLMHNLDVQDVLSLNDSDVPTRRVVDAVMDLTANLATVKGLTAALIDSTATHALAKGEAQPSSAWWEYGAVLFVLNDAKAGHGTEAGQDTEEDEDPDASRTCAVMVWLPSRNVCSLYDHQQGKCRWKAERIVALINAARAAEVRHASQERAESAPEADTREVSLPQREDTLTLEVPALANFPPPTASLHLLLTMQNVAAALMRLGELPPPPTLNKELHFIDNITSIVRLSLQRIVLQAVGARMFTRGQGVQSFSYTGDLTNLREPFRFVGRTPQLGARRPTFAPSASPPPAPSEREASSLPSAAATLAAAVHSLRDCGWLAVKLTGCEDPALSALAATTMTLFANTTVLHCTAAAPRCLRLVCTGFDRRLCDALGMHDHVATLAAGGHAQALDVLCALNAHPEAGPRLAHAMAQFERERARFLRTCARQDAAFNQLMAHHIATGLQFGRDAPCPCPDILTPNVLARCYEALEAYDPAALAKDRRNLAALADTPMGQRFFAHAVQFIQ